MKITNKILKHRAKQALDTATYLDISGLGIGAIEGLGHCGRIQVLDLSHNNIEEVEGIKCCEHLWNVNLSHNQISSLSEVSHFYAFGTLDLSYNNITWKELGRIQNVVILDLHLIGNPELEKDSCYRVHVIDCLPNIWMLDGRIVTSAERNQTQNFFHDSALSSRPVRRKLGERPLTTRQRIHQSSIHGVRTAVLVSKFARNEIHSAGTDQRRLSFLFENMQTDLSMIPKCFVGNSSFPNDYLLEIITARAEEREHCNVLLLILLATLEFSIPGDLLNETLRITKLQSYAQVDIPLLFTLSRQWKIRLSSLLLSACKLDRDVCLEGDGGLYDRLYLCLYYLVSDLIRCDWKNWRRRSSTRVDKAKDQRMHMSSYLRPHTAPNLKEASYAKRLVEQSKEEHLTLLASEILLLLNVVPSFYKFIENDPAVRALLQTATGDLTLTSKMVEIAKETREQGGDMQSLCNEISDHSLHQIERSTFDVRYAPISQYLFPASDNKFLPSNETRSEWKVILDTKKAYPKRPKSAVLSSGEHLTSGRRRASPHIYGNPPLKAAALSTCANEPRVTLGSNILLGPQNMARVIAIPEPNIGLVQMNSIPAPNGAIIIQSRNEDDHYCYVDIKNLEYDTQLSCWKPIGSIGDKVTLHAAVQAKRIDATTNTIRENATRHRAQRKLSHGYRSRLSSMAQDQESAASQILSAKHNINIDLIIDASEKYSESDIGQTPLPPRPLSAVFKEKMNLSLPAPTHDAGTDPEMNPVDYASSAQTVLLDKSCLIAGDIVDGETQIESELDTVNDREGVSVPAIEIVEPNDTTQDVEGGTTEPLSQLHKEQMSEEINSGDLSSKASDVAHNLEDELAFVDNDQEPELEALMDKEPVDSPKHLAVERNMVPRLGRRAISARRPKHTKTIHSARPLSAVTGRQKNLSKLYGDSVAFDRPDSASSFQLERTEAWRSSASSSMNLTLDDSMLKSANVRFSPNAAQSRKANTGLQVVALRPTPPQRPSSPLQSSPDKRHSLEVERSRQSTPAIRDQSKDGGIKLANNWLAQGKDLHEEYKKSRVYMSPHVPGYLSGIVDRPQSNKMTCSLPLTASLNIKSDGPPSVRSSRRPTPTSTLRDYGPPGIGIPMSEFKTRYSSVGDVRQISAKYPTISLLRPQKK